MNPEKPETWKLSLKKPEKPGVWEILKINWKFELNTLEKLWTFNNFYILCSNTFIWHEKSTKLITFFCQHKKKILENTFNVALQ